MVSVVNILPTPAIVISNNSSFHLNRRTVPFGSDGSDGSSYCVLEKYMIPVAQATDPVAYIPFFFAPEIW